VIVWTQSGDAGAVAGAALLAPGLRGIIEDIMRLRTLALAVALAFSFSVAGEAKKKVMRPVAKSFKVKKANKAKKFKQPKRHKAKHH
jgi:ABC-type transporter MlaC component